MTESIHIREIVETTGGFSLGPADVSVRHLATDSRALPGTNQVMFVAIRGVHHDGNDYIGEVYNRGGRVFLTDKKPDTSQFPDATFCVVDNALHALHNLAEKRRNDFKGTVIAVAGSNGKTIVKEWAYQILQRKAAVVRSPRSYNSQLGVPLSLWQLNNQFRFAIFEAGISKPGEMQKLEKIIHPEIGVFTNIGSAHGENFNSNEHKLEEKLALFKGSKKLIHRKQQVSYVDYFQNAAKLSITWSFSETSDYRCKLNVQKGGGLDLEIMTSEASFHFNLPFSDEASVENLINVIVLMLELGLDEKEINEGLQQLEPVEMRLETLQGQNHSTLINDGYNSDITGLRVALDVLDQQKQHRKRIAILSDLLQSNLDDAALYREVSTLLNFRKLDHIYCIGPGSMRQANQFPDQTVFFPDVEAFLKSFNPEVMYDSAILIKGARKFKFEEITRQLQLKIHRTVLEINMNALVDNLNYFRSLLEPGTRLMVMVKALAYGSGAVEIAGYLQHEQIDYLAVAFPDEGIELRKNGIYLPIMVMNSDSGDYRKLLEYNIEPEIYSREGLLSFIKECRYSGIEHQPIHIKLDTGMHRLGFDDKDIDWLCKTLQTSDIKVASIFSHLAGSGDVRHDDFTSGQVRKLENMSKKIMEVTGNNVILHVLNSAGIERFSQYQLDMVRVGIGLYGVGIGDALRLVSTFKTAISQIRDLAPGETVGYGRNGKIDKESRIATIPVGYADGISRSLGNGNYAFFVNGNYAPVVGDVCMDMTMIDITGIKAEVGDTVELFGENLPVDKMAEKLGTIVYEIFTGIPERVKRIYIRE